MQTVCLELSKYVLAFLMAFYALAAYRGAVIRNEDKRKKIYRIQNIIMVIVPVSYTHLTLPTIA